MKIKIFIDSNIYLSFYSGLLLTNIKLLKGLKEYADSEDIELITTEQVINEVYRNRDEKVSRTWKDISDLQERFSSKYNQLTPLQMDVLKDNQQWKKTKEFMNKYNRTLKPKIRSLIGNIEDALKNGGEVDITISNLFESSSMINITDEIIKLAEKRVRLGNPPKKVNLL